MPARGRTTQQLRAALAAEGTRPNYDHYKQDNDSGRWRAAAAAWVASWGGRDAPARPGPAWTTWWGTQKKQHTVLLAAAREQGVEPNAGDAAAAEERAAAAAAEDDCMGCTLWIPKRWQACGVPGQRGGKNTAEIEVLRFWRGLGGGPSIPNLLPV